MSVADVLNGVSVTNVNLFLKNTRKKNVLIKYFVSHAVEGLEVTVM